MTVGPIDDRHPDVKHREKEKQRKKAVEECSHAATAGTIQLHNGKVIAECADCPAEQIEATKLYQQQAEKGTVMVENWGAVE